MTWLCLLIATLAIAVAAFRKAWPYSVLAVLLIVGSIFPFRLLGGNDAWFPKFTSSKSARAALIQDAVGRKPGEYPLPYGAKTLSNMSWYVIHENGKGRWICYTVYTQGVDNAVGFAFNHEGKPPPRAAFYEIVNSEDLGSGWFIFRTT
jgi:hypothetical protein